MKNCPFCKAEIEDNARFCLYCMKPLEGKETIASPVEKKRRWPLLAAGVVLLAGLLCLLLAFCTGEEGSEQMQSTTSGTAAATAQQESSGTVDEPPVDTTPQETIPQETIPQDTIPQDTIPQETVSQETPAPSESTQPTTETTTKPSENTDPTVSAKPDSLPEPEPTQCVHDYILSGEQAVTCDTDGFSTYTCDKCGDSYQQTVAAPGHQYAPATCLSPKVCEECGQTDGDPLGHSYTDGYCVRCDAPDYRDPKVVFEYRTVGPNDYFGYISDTDIVVTGVKEVSPDGIYEVPSHIDGKPVVGILSLAFSGSDAREVTLPETVIRVNQNAFAGCEDLESLYIRSNALFLSRSAFSAPLTIYCSADCVVDDDLYGECYLKDIVRVYGAQWKEWNGE